MSNLEGLPVGVRKKILQQLLAADNVRQPPNQYMVEDYKFETNILLVNKTIHAEASKVLYEDNVFAKVHWKYIDGEKIMTNHEVPFFKLTGNKLFTRHAVDITITPNSIPFRKATPPKDKTPQSYIMLAQDISKLARLVQILDVANSAQFDFKFEFHTRPSDSESNASETNTSLLLPFEQVRGVKTVQTVSITGPIDPVIATRVKKAMTQKISWYRADQWRIYELMLSIKRVGDLAFKLGNGDITLAKYDDARAFRDAALQNDRAAAKEMVRVADFQFHTAMAHIDAVIFTDLALLWLSDTTVREVGSRQYQITPTYTEKVQIAADLTKGRTFEKAVPAEVIARFYHLLGIAELGLNHPVKASKAFHKAHGMKYQGAKDGWQAAKDWKGLSTTNRQSRLDTLLTAIPTTTFDIPDVPSYQVFEVDPEQHVMRQLGFDGKFPYEDKIKGCITIASSRKTLHPDLPGVGLINARFGVVIPGKLQRHVNKYRRCMRSAPEMICRVGLKGEDEVGEAPIIDHPHMQTLLELSTRIMIDKIKDGTISELGNRS